MSCAPATFSISRWRTAVALVAMSVALGAVAHETDDPLSDPGYRPHSEHALAFVESWPNATVAVLPAIVRRLDRTAHSFASQAQLVSLLEQAGVTASAVPVRIDRGEYPGEAQWNTFRSGMEAVANALTDRAPDADYAVVLEILMYAGDQEVFGLHVFVLDGEGRNAFSFLLNSHHRAFVETGLRADDRSEAARSALMEKATELAMTALDALIEAARRCATHFVPPPHKVGAGVIDGFEAGLPAGHDAYGNALGFVTLGDPNSRIGMSATTDYPELPPKIDRNTVLRLDVEVVGWAAVVHFFHDAGLEHWVPQDWNGATAVSFWLHGNGSGTELFVDVLDNRSDCSTIDDAERYVYSFRDDFTGWERVTIPFSDMVRKEVGNGAPDDRLGLRSVHGWAFGVLATDGPLTFYIDDVELVRTVPDRKDYPLNELPMFGGREKTAAQKRADSRYIAMATRGGRSREEAAEAAAKVGWSLYYRGDEATAMKRFNQAWLLDPDNQLALWGFAVISSGRGDLEEGVRLFRMALEGGPEPNLRRDYEFALKQLAKQGGQPPDR